MGALDFALVLVDGVADADMVTTTVWPGAMLVTMDGEAMEGGGACGEDVGGADDVVDEEAVEISLPL